MTNKYVITGGPCSGKTTMWELAFERRIYRVAEAATNIIEDQLRKKKSDILPWKNRDKFQREVLKTQLEWEREIPEKIKTAILDRGIPDGIAYYRLDNIEPPKELMDAARKTDYKKIFIVEPLMTYENTEYRKEDKRIQQKIHEKIREVYESLRYLPIRVPVMSPEERMDFILEEIRKE